VARRYLALYHLLTPPRSLPPGPASVMAVVDHLGSLQFDPLDIAGRNHDLVLNARIDAYRREHTDALLYEERRLYETYNKGLSLVPTAHLPWFRVDWDRHRVSHEGGAFEEHRALVEELLERIRTTGPMSSSDVEPRGAIDWYWRPTNQVRAILEALAEAGILGIARREGNRRVYDLMERLFPADLLAQRPRARDQYRHKLLSRYRGNGLLGSTGGAELWWTSFPYRAQGTEDGVPLRTAGRRQLQAQLIEEGALIPVEVPGMKGHRYVPADALPRLDQAEDEVAAGLPSTTGVAFLAPLDPLVWDRDLLRALYDFDYVWEVYVPAAKRRWGYYVLPIHHGDRFVGRIEPRFERKRDTLDILGLWWEDGFDPLDEVAAPGFVDAFAEAIRAHLAFGGVTTVAFPNVARLRPFERAVRARLDPTPTARPARRARTVRT
jgi:uncharacterized protein